jgi:hypothetical protein
MSARVRLTWRPQSPSRRSFQTQFTRDPIKAFDKCTYALFGVPNPPQLGQTGFHPRRHGLSCILPDADGRVCAGRTFGVLSNEVRYGFDNVWESSGTEGVR